MRVIKIIFTLTMLITAFNTLSRTKGIGGDTGGPKQTWQDIMKDPKVRPAFPLISIEDHMVSYNFLCIENDVVRTRYKVKVTSDFTDEVLFKYLYEDNSSSAGNQCMETGLPRELPIYVYRVNSNPRQREVLYIKSYALPDCP